MAVEDHPKFDAWAEALKALKEATEVYKEAVSRNVRPGWVEHAKHLRDIAQEHFDRVSEDLDDA